MDKHIAAALAILNAMLGVANGWSGWGWLLVIALFCLKDDALRAFNAARAALKEGE